VWCWVKRDTRYVTADDMLPVLDTVEEVLTFYAEFGLPLSMSKGEKDERVQNVMDLMALNHISRTFVGGQLGAGISVRGVSGGEKRRVSIGCVSLSLPAPFILLSPGSPGDELAGESIRAQLPHRVGRLSKWTKLRSLRLRSTPMCRN
jgi:ATP-binding cassette subfamily G (WHITE) protein 2